MADGKNNALVLGALGAVGDLLSSGTDAQAAQANAQAAYAQSQAAAAAASAEKAETRKLMMFGGGLLGLVGLVALARR